MHEKNREQLIKFLQSVGANERPHSQRSLIDHLVGTEKIMALWGCDEDSCAAGLFHSIYGTNSFKAACLSMDQRSEIRALIGEKAEHLVFLFCSSNRPDALLNACKSGYLKNRFSGQQIHISKVELRQLIEIECANLLEQGSKSQFLRSIIPACTKTDIVLSEKIVADVSNVANATVTAKNNFSERLTIERANDKDISGLISMFRQVHVDSRYAWTRFDQKSGQVRLLQAIENPREFVLIARIRQEIIGFLIAKLECVPFTAISIGICEYVFVDPRRRGLVGLRLFLEFKKWAKLAGASEIRIIDSFGEVPKRSSRYFERIGLNYSGGCFSLWI